MAEVPGAFQNFYRPPDATQTDGKSTPYGVSPLSAETQGQLAFPYHTFVIIDTKAGELLKQHTLILNPQDFSQREPVRGQVVQTLGGAYVDDFGRGLPKVQISGNTGWRLKHMPDGAGLLDGWQAFKALRSDIFRFYTDAKDEVRTFLHNPNYEMRWYNWGEDEYYAIHPEDFQLQRSASNPLLYQYSFPFTCIRDLRVGYLKYNINPVLFKLGATTSIKDASGSIGVSISNLGQLAKYMSS